MLAAKRAARVRNSLSCSSFFMTDPEQPEEAGGHFGTESAGPSRRPGRRGAKADQRGTDASTLS
jgi:hypothetical protein